MRCRTAGHHRVRHCDAVAAARRRLAFGGNRLALGAALQLPSLAAAELERKGTFSQEKLAQAEHFALTDYLSTLAGAPPQGEAAHAFYARWPPSPGCRKTWSRSRSGFIRDSYVKNLDVGAHKIVSHYDATFAVDDPNPDQVAARGPDPLLDGVVRAYGGAYAAYARDELGFKTEMTYILLASDIPGKWDWGEAPDGSAPTSSTICARSCADAVLPAAWSRTASATWSRPMRSVATCSTICRRWGWRMRTQLRLYRGGHMLYLDPNSRKTFTADARTLYAAP